MDGRIKRLRFAFLALFHLGNKDFHSLISKFVNLLTDCADRNDCLVGNGRTIKTYQSVIVRKFTIFFKEKIQKYIGQSIVGEKNSFSFLGIGFFKIIYNRLKAE